MSFIASVSTPPNSNADRNRIRRMDDFEAMNASITGIFSGDEPIICVENNMPAHMRGGFVICHLFHIIDRISFYILYLWSNICLYLILVTLDEAPGMREAATWLPEKRAKIQCQTPTEGSRPRVLWLGITKRDDGGHD